MKNLVVIGGGFAGTKIAKFLENKFKVTLIDSKLEQPYQVIQVI